MVDFKSLVPWRNEKSQLPATRENFFDPFVAFRREMDRMFDDFFGGSALRPAFGGWQSTTPVVDIDETDKELVVTAELPSVSDKDVEVSLAGDILTIKGEKKAAQEQKTATPTTRSAVSAPSRARSDCRSSSRMRRSTPSSRMAC